MTIDISLWAVVIGFCGGGVAGAIILLARAKPRHVHHMPDQPLTTFVFSGNLKQTGLLDAIQFLEIGRREGILHIYCGRRKGYLTFAEGKVVDAFWRNLTGKEAIFPMLDLAEGDFYFEPKKILQPKLISESIFDITFEWDARKK